MADKISAWEQHGQSVVTSIVLAILLWVGYNVNEGAKHDAVMTVEIIGMKDQISELKGSINGDVKRFGEIQSSRGPRILANELDIKEIYRIIRTYHDHSQHNKRTRGR